jgi:hypothetical protein
VLSFPAAAPPLSAIAEDAATCIGPVLKTGNLFLVTEVNIKPRASLEHRMIFGTLSPRNIQVVYQQTRRRRSREGIRRPRNQKSKKV